MRRASEACEARRAARPETPAPTDVANATSDTANGGEIYERVCADCHGDDGEGKDAWPPLKRSVAAAAPDPVNAVRLVLYGAMAPTTPGNPRPYSMPPFVQQLTSAEIAAVVNFIRRDASPPSRLTATDIESMHGIVLE